MTFSQLQMSGCLLFCSLIGCLYIWLLMLLLAQAFIWPFTVLWIQFFLCTAAKQSKPLKISEIFFKAEGINIEIIMVAMPLLEWSIRPLDKDLLIEMMWTTMLQHYQFTWLCLRIYSVCWYLPCNPPQQPWAPYVTLKTAPNWPIPHPPEVFFMV